jgi:hypothetical protein
VSATDAPASPQASSSKQAIRQQGEHKIEKTKENGKGEEGEGDVRQASESAAQAFAAAPSGHPATVAAHRADNGPGLAQGSPAVDTASEHASAERSSEPRDWVSAEKDMSRTCTGAGTSAHVSGVASQSALGATSPPSSDVEGGASVAESLGEGSNTTPHHSVQGGDGGGKGVAMLSMPSDTLSGGIGGSKAAEARGSSSICGSAARVAGTEGMGAEGTGASSGAVGGGTSGHDSMPQSVASVSASPGANASEVAAHVSTSASSTLRRKHAGTVLELRT